MRCELVAEVPVHRFALFAEMARVERRPELGMLCRASREAGDRLDARTVEQVLPGLGSSGRENIVAWCRMLRLCDGRGALTALGLEAAERDVAPVPEQGVFDLWVAKHPLLGARILHVARVKATRDGRFDMIAPLPIAPDRDRVFASVIDPTAQWVFRGSPSSGGDHGCMPRSPQPPCTIRWAIDFSAGEESFKLEGTLDHDGDGRGFRHAPEPAGTDLEELLDDWTRSHLSRFGRWTQEGRLAVSVAGLAEAAQESFCQSYSLDAVTALDRGSYAAVQLEDVPIGPSTKADAERWAGQRCARRLRRTPAYRTRRELCRFFASAVEGTPLAPHRPTLPAHTALLSEYDGEPGMLWALAAPVDLSPSVVDARELDAFVAGGGAR